ncbi:MAG: sulfotransferase [Kineosporiaceae bacterium]|nr:sulfotransferase [Kineosporiaceae bacterium]
MIESIGVVAGVPRSGTSWLGMLIDSSPAVNYRFQPFFAYAFKDSVTADSSPQEFAALMRRMDGHTDEFLAQADKRSAGLYPTFTKHNPTTTLALKMCRYQYLIPTMLEHLPQLRLVGIVRHPCGVLHSWSRNPKEFPPGSDLAREWRFGACKNQGREENFFGFHKWREVAHLYLDLAVKYPDRVRVISYEALVAETEKLTHELFEFLDLEVSAQTEEFVRACHASHSDSPYAVFKDPSVATHWRRELDPAIQRAVVREVQGTPLERFLA